MSQIVNGARLQYRFEVTAKIESKKTESVSVDGKTATIEGTLYYMPCLDGKETSPFLSAASRIQESIEAAEEKEKKEKEATTAQTAAPPTTAVVTEKKQLESTSSHLKVHWLVFWQGRLLPNASVPEYAYIYSYSFRGPLV
jgi:hypothetical protein